MIAMVTVHPPGPCGTEVGGLGRFMRNTVRHLAEGPDLGQRDNDFVVRFDVSDHSRCDDQSIFWRVYRDAYKIVPRSYELVYESLQLYINICHRGYIQYLLKLPINIYKPT